MDQKQIEQLMADMERSRIKRLMIKRKDFEIEIERECAVPPPAYSPPPHSYIPPHFHGAANMPLPAVSSTNGGETKEASPGHYVTSPIVGTFYASPSPEMPSFVKVGDSVNEETIVCIIEAMKVMNEVKAGIKGTITEILVKSSEPVEFGTRIFKIQPL